MADIEREVRVTREVSASNGSDSTGIVSILAILLLVIVAGFIAYRVFTKPVSNDTVAPQDSNSATQPSGDNSTTTTVIENNVASGTLNATTTTTF